MASSSSSSSQSSSSTPIPINTPASDWALTFAKALQGLGQQQYQWAQGEYGKASDITDQQIQNFVDLAQTGKNFAGNLIDRYQNTFAPMENTYANQAQQWGSSERIGHEMGAAESGASQAGEAGLHNAEQELQSFGVDPSSGRYQDLVRASRTASAASAAAAGEQARRDVEGQANQRQINAIQMGQQLPGAAMNSVNAAYNGISGAENAALGRLNAGVNAVKAGDQTNATAMGVKYPPVGQQSQSHGQSGSQSNNPGQPQQQRPGGGGGGGGSPTGGGYGGGYNPGGYGGGGGNGVGPGGGSGGRPSAGTNIRSGLDDGYSQPDNYNPNAYTQGAADVYNQNGAGDMGNQWDPSGGVNADWGNAPTWTGGFGNTQGADWGTDNSYQGWDDSASQGSGSSMGGWDTGVLSGDYGGSSGGANWGSGGGGGYDESTFDYGYAEGGGVVPTQMSPSGGQQTDDIPAVINQTGGQARLNADEFVIPRDVAMWKGQEFFQNLINKSREARGAGSAKPTMGAPNGQ